MNRTPTTARRWVARLAAGAATAAVAVGTMAAPAHAATACESDCIASASVTATPDGADVAVTTSSPTRVSVAVKLGASTVLTFGDTGPDYTTAHTLSRTSGLLQRTWYTFVVSATDNYGHTWSESFVARTPHRSATVRFTNVYLVNDSDDAGAGEFARATSVAGTTKYAGSLFSAASGLASISSGSNYTPGMSTTVPTAVNPMPVKLMLTDDDYDGFVVDSSCATGVLGSPFTAAAKYSSFGAGGDNCADWNTASAVPALSSTIGLETRTYQMRTSTAAPEFIAGYAIDTEVVNVPSRPAAPNAIAGNGAAKVIWTAPAANGRAITGYTVTASNGRTCTTVGTTCVVSGLVNGTPVTFSVKARNAEGDSAASATSATVTPKAVPFAPVIAAAVGGNGAATVTVTPPAGTPVTGYRVISVPGNKTVTGTTPTLTVTGLTNGATYSFVAQAYNANGWSLTGPSSVAVRPGIASTISNWDNTPVVAAAGTTVNQYLTVGPNGTGRTGRLQFRRVGTTTWTTQTVAVSPVNGNLLFTIPVKTGSHEWRAVLDAQGVYAGAVTPTRVVTARTTVAGFNAAAVNASLGTILKDAITVAPGFLRTVQVQYRKSTVNTWTTYASLATDAAGNVTISEKVLAGKYYWRVYVPATSLHGAAAVTSTRTVNAL